MPAAAHWAVSIAGQQGGAARSSFCPEDLQAGLSSVEGGN
jgi:hypothetical protein